MTIMPEARGWRAVHIHSEAAIDDSLVLAMASAVTDLAADATSGDWFFIRYNEGGHHLRLRLGPALSPLCPKIIDALANRLGIPTEDRRRTVPSVNMRPRPDRIVESSYVPEVDRYGGPAALIENEVLFRISSALAVRALAATIGDRPRRARLAVDLMMATAASLSADVRDAAQFFSDYALFWRQHLGLVPETISPAKMEPGTGFAERFAMLAGSIDSATPSGRWIDELRRTRARMLDLVAGGQLGAAPHAGRVTNMIDAERAIRSMFISQLHMMNNRLGFAPYQELLWAMSIASALHGKPR